MRSLKLFLVGVLIIFLIGLTSNCKWLKNPFGPDLDDELKFATNVEIIYERTSSLSSNGHVYLNIYAADVVEWSPIQNETMEKIADQQFKYVVGKLPADVKLYAVVDDGEFYAEKIIVNGTELTDIRNDPSGNDWQVAYFKIKENGTVVP